MDPRRFDTLAKTLSSPSTRRSALAALLSGSLGLHGLRQPAVGWKRRGGGDVTIEGPCGDGSGPHNACDRHSDCCTGICQWTRRGRPKRCRCRRQGQACTETINCCQGAGQGLVCCDGSCEAVECCNDAGCDGGELCSPDNGTCTVTCNNPGGDCTIGENCACELGYGGFPDDQPICVDLGACTCITDCADCPSGQLCDDFPPGPCGLGEVRCCATCGGT